MHNKHIFFALICAGASCAQAQQSLWTHTTTTNVVYGTYFQSQTLEQQTGAGLKLKSEHDQQWGFTLGTLYTRANTKTPSTNVQESWLIAPHLHLPSAFEQGRWTLQLDTHQIHRTASIGDASAIRAVTPKITWRSHERPLALGVSHTNSTYQDAPSINQYTATLGFGLPTLGTWFEIQHHDIQGLNPATAQGLTHTTARDIQLIQNIRSTTPLVPHQIILGAQINQRIYDVDINNQTVNYLPMLNKGGHHIAAYWHYRNNNLLMLGLNRTNYASQLPTPHDFTLTTLNLQYANTWQP